MKPPFGTGPILGLDDSTARFASELARSALPDLVDREWPDRIHMTRAVRVCGYDVYKHVGRSARGPKARCGTEGDVLVLRREGVIRFRESCKRTAGFEIHLAAAVRDMVATKSGLVRVLEACLDLPDRAATPDQIRQHERNTAEAGKLIAAALDGILQAGPPEPTVGYSPPMSLNPPYVIVRLPDGTQTCYHPAGSRTHPEVHGLMSEPLCARLAEMHGDITTCRTDGKTTKRMMIGRDLAYHVKAAEDPMEAVRAIRAIGAGPHFEAPVA